MEGKIQENFEKINSTLTSIEKQELFDRKNPSYVTQKLGRRIVIEIFRQLTDDKKAKNRCRAVISNLGRSDSKNFYLCLVTKAFKVRPKFQAHYCIPLTYFLTYIQKQFFIIICFNFID